MSGIEPGVLYVMVDDRGAEKGSFGVTPDGVGMHWYDTREQAVADRLDLPEDFEEIEVTDDELEELRNPQCEGHPDDDYSIMAGMPAGETHYCNGRCRR